MLWCPENFCRECTVSVFAVLPKKLLSRRYSECQCLLCCPKNSFVEKVQRVCLLCCPDFFCRECIVSMFAVLPRKLLSRMCSECVCCAAQKNLSRRYSVFAVLPQKRLSRRYSSVPKLVLSRAAKLPPTHSGRREVNWSSPKTAQDLKRIVE